MSLRRRDVVELSSDAGSSKRRSTPRLAQRNSTASLRDAVASDTDQSEILSPTPRRHAGLLQPWLLAHNGPTHTPISSRGGSPASVVSYATRSPFNFAALHEQSRGSASQASSGLARRAVRWLRNAGLRDYIMPIIIAFALLVRWATGLGTYSGFATPPMRGDYEAQRHWMELTLHLPLSRWYTYDLQYWGLDYPPLTAYVSWLCGVVGAWIEPSWFALDESRGIETPGSKIYMRATVLAFDALIYIPAVVTFVRRWSSSSRSHTSQHAALLTLLLQPALLLIDFGHFQYNSVMLGLMVHSLNAFAADRELLGAVFFVASLCFKQMALYYAVPVFGYLLGRCVAGGRVEGTRLFVMLGLTTVAAFALMFAPWMWPPTALLDPVTRIFPVGRGLFEDKVANFWCASDVVLKWRRRLAAPTLLRLSAAATAVGFLPSLVLLVRAGFVAAPGTGGKAGLALLPHALFGSAMSFFLFSFQVHEKSVLLPLLPLWLIMAAGDAAVAEWGALVSNVAVFSMWSLLKRDGLGTQYLALTALWNWLAGTNPLRMRDPLTKYLSIAVYTSIALLHTAELLVDPPARYPDLFPVLNVLLCAPVFGLAWLWSTARIVQVAWAIGVLGGSRREVVTKKEHEAMVEETVPGEL